MKLVEIVQASGKSSTWINPEHVLTVFETNIGHKNRGIIGTGILMVGMNPFTTTEPIESVIQRLQGGAA